MQYPVNIPGFENSELAVELPGVFSGARLLVNGQPASPGRKKREYLLVRDDGKVVSAKLGAVFLDGVPKLIVDGETHQVAESLAWYQWAWSCIPFVLVFVGGAIGGAIGGAGSVINSRIFRSGIKPPAQYLVTGLISGAAVILYAVAAALVHQALPDSWKQPSAAKGSGNATAPEHAAPPKDVIAEARNQVAQGQAWRVVETLAGNQSPEALEILLPLLDLPDNQSPTRVKAVTALAQWRTAHERIGQAFMARLPAGQVQEAPPIFRALADWGLKQHAPALAQLLVTTKDRSLWRPLSDALCRLATPECTPILLGALPLPIAQDMQYSRSKDARKFLTNREHFDVLQRALAVMPVLGAIGDPQSVPALIEYLNVDIYNHTWQPASIALGKIGTDEAIAAIEKAMETHGGQNTEAQRMFLAGLHRSQHPRGRAVLARCFSDPDIWLRRDAAAALAETAAPADAAIVATALENPDPILHQQVLAAIPRLLPDGRAAVGEMYTRAFAARRYRTAMVIAEALPDSKRSAEARQALDALRQGILQEPRLDHWFGKKQADVLAQFPDAKLKTHVRTKEAPTLIVRTDMGSTFDVPGRLSFWGGREAAGPFMGIEAHEKYDRPVYGVRLGDPSLLAWEIHGNSPSEGVGDLVYHLTPPGGLAIKLRYMSTGDKVERVEIRRE